MSEWTPTTFESLPPMNATVEQRCVCEVPSPYEDGRTHSYWPDTEGSTLHRYVSLYGDEPSIEWRLKR